ncbi:GDSL-type esterase/lipase family protein [Flavisolibacter ginsenosidimutans]|uniref:G-D-S-L family lipolytic protein n=1 Tax=Flavisolibacter ginsenosidimutans TaxID=661481 RepID=A0A5B8UNH0_9BACT|nr:GDSL-type esterase/lipase family protein [Flavisolibacter ginsenosidimutans]QEC58128.1 G-D-S-L family lipolytic protein [Flavisolibacter ginsenosidimutans]
MKKALTKFFFFVCLLQSIVANAQGGSPYFNEIQSFKKEDSVHVPPQKAILFVGSSTFRLWPDIQSYFPAHTIINRGFGGSTLADVIRYESDVIFPYKPKQIVIYCGDNDLASSDTVSSTTVVQRFEKLFTDIRTALPNVPIAFVSIKPSPSRWHLKEKMIDANRRIKTFLTGKKKTSFIDIWNAMLGPDGKPREELFKEDRLHMKPEGYAIWQKIIEPKLL